MGDGMLYYIDLFIYVIFFLAFIYFFIFVLPRIFKNNHFWPSRKNKNTSKWKSPGDIKPYASSTFKNNQNMNTYGPYALPYTIRLCLLSTRELEFYKILLRILKEHRYTIAIKPRVSEFI